MPFITYFCPINTPNNDVFKVILCPLLWSKPSKNRITFSSVLGHHKCSSGGFSGCRYSLCVSASLQHKSSNMPLHPGRSARVGWRACFQSCSTKSIRFSSTVQSLDCVTITGGIPFKTMWDSLKIFPRFVTCKI